MKNTGLAVTIDIGDAADIHPKNKRDVGNRLALIALDQHYGKKQPFSGPQFAKLEKIPGGLKIHFTHADGGLSVKGEKLEEFAICGADKKWHWANAKSKTPLWSVRRKCRSRWPSNTRGKRIPKQPCSTVRVCLPCRFRQTSYCASGQYLTTSPEF